MQGWLPVKCHISQHCEYGLGLFEDIDNPNIKECRQIISAYTGQPIELYDNNEYFSIDEIYEWIDLRNIIKQNAVHNILT